MEALKITAHIINHVPSKSLPKTLMNYGMVESLA
jgi:hypothetical protein